MSKVPGMVPPVDSLMHLGSLMDEGAKTTQPQKV